MARLFGGCARSGKGERAPLDVSQAAGSERSEFFFELIELDRASLKSVRSADGQVWLPMAGCSM